jgi:hypothetical protein
MAGIQKFFQIALANEFYKLLVDEQRFDHRALLSGVDPEVLGVIVSYANTFLVSMLDTLSKMPPLIRYASRKWRRRPRRSRTRTQTCRCFSSRICFSRA